MIWITVCDGAQAKIFKKEHRFSPLEYLESFIHTHELTHEHGRDKPGREGLGAMMVAIPMTLKLIGMMVKKKYLLRRFQLIY